MGKKNDGLLLGAAIVGGILFLPGLLQKTEAATQGALNYFGSDGGGGIDLSWLGGLLGGAGEVGAQAGNGISDFIAGLSLGGGGLFGGGDGGGSFDLNSFLGGLFAGGGAGGGLPQGTTPGQGGLTPGTPDNTSWWSTPLIPSTGNTPVDWGNAISQTAMSLAKAGLTGAGIYAGAKVGIPVLQTIAPRVASTLTTPVSQIAGQAGRLATSAARTSVTGIQAAGRTALTALRTPVSQIATRSVAGALGTVASVAAAGYTGYQLGQMFNRTAAGQALIEASGRAGAAVARGSNPVQRILFPSARTTELANTTLLTKTGYSAEQVKAMFASGMSTAEVRAKLGIGK